MPISAALVGISILAGCGRPPGVDASTADPAPAPALTGPPSSAPPGTPTPSASGVPSASPSRSAPADGFPVAVAVDCAGRPSAAQVVALLRRTDGLLPAGVQVSVPVAPRCAGSWQYTVVQIPSREPLQVVTEGSPTSFTLVTAGTDVCVIPVRVGAPAGIRTLACESVPIPPTTP
ncbi:hypothetical protein O7543_21115 [Solwaraspora sp. WMMA2080]|nr:MULTISPECIES: hypothetical protein [unclassified Solwaraspora]WBC00474.1 hypothetical protein O7553_26255 [Solwaraspora sp. WMMA2059]WBC23917.1 hypothetical protein O7543_21115 [Solwaraspora sp. WMMA2080]WJK37864.1 hypothetical protein O7610_21220 [Solwaraspora sp. WMMA2065]